MTAIYIICYLVGVPLTFFTGKLLHRVLKGKKLITFEYYLLIVICSLIWPVVWIPMIVLIIIQIISAWVRS